MEPINIIFILGIIFQSAGFNFWNLPQSGYTPAAMKPVTHSLTQSRAAHR